MVNSSYNGGDNLSELTKYRPFRVIDKILSDWDDVLTWPVQVTPKMRMPLMDIKENEKNYKVELEVPGIKKENIKIEVTNSRVIEIKAKEKEEKEEEQEDNYLKKEILERSFYRRFMLPSEIDSDRIDAKSDNGMLIITLPKEEPSKPELRTIEVR